MVHRGLSQVRRIHSDPLVSETDIGNKGRNRVFYFVVNNHFGGLSWCIDDFVAVSLAGITVSGHSQLVSLIIADTRVHNETSLQVTGYHMYNQSKSLSPTAEPARS